MVNHKNIIVGPKINISGSMRPAEIVKLVVNTFIDFEKYKKGKGVVFKYPVEEFKNGEILFISRPGKKWNFDFKVDLKPEYHLEKGTHDQIAIILRSIKKEWSDEFSKLWSGLLEIYDCSECDVSKILKETPISIKSDTEPEILLKVIKWLFKYWNLKNSNT